MDPQKILIVDDEQDFLETMAERLAFEGFVPLKATSGEEALTVLGRERPALILLDVMMPGMDGLEFFRRLRQDNAHAAIPVIFISVRWEFFNAPSISSDRRTRVLRKPFDPDLLIRTVRDCLAET